MSLQLIRMLPIVPLHLTVIPLENKELYGILSKGIHELDEKDCLDHFDTVKVGIEMILDEKLDQLNKKKKRRRPVSKFNKLLPLLENPTQNLYIL